MRTVARLAVSTDKKFKVMNAGWIPQAAFALSRPWSRRVDFLARLLLNDRHMKAMKEIIKVAIKVNCILRRHSDGRGPSSALYLLKTI